MNRNLLFLQFITIQIKVLFFILKEVARQGPAEGVIPVFSPKTFFIPSNWLVFFHTYRIFLPWSIR